MTYVRGIHATPILIAEAGAVSYMQLFYMTVEAKVLAWYGALYSLLLLDWFCTTRD